MMMENEYVFDYDEVKQRFESVPFANAMVKKFKSATYKTRFQPRTKSVLGKTDLSSNIHPAFVKKIQRQASPKVTFQVHVVHVHPPIPYEPFRSTTAHGLYLMPNRTISLF